MSQNDFRSYEAFYDQLIANLRINLPSPVLARKPEFRLRSNRLKISLQGIRGSHYEMCFRRKYHEFAVHFESTPGRSLARRRAFEPHLQELSQKIGQNIRFGPHENRGWMRVWMQLPPTESIMPLLEGYQDLFLSFIEETYPILDEVYVQEASEKSKG